MALVIFDNNATTLERIRTELGDAEQIEIFFGNGPTATADCALDALWVTTMQGERFGLPGNLASGECVIGRNHPEMVAKGLPQHIVACGTDDAPDWLRVATRAVVHSITDFNREHKDTEAIRRVGVIPEILGVTLANVRSVLAVVKDEWDV